MGIGVGVGMLRQQRVGGGELFEDPDVGWGGALLAARSSTVSSVVSPTSSAGTRPSSR